VGWEGALCERQAPSHCLGGCSGKGECRGGTCHCVDGFYGADCSLFSSDFFGRAHRLTYGCARRARRSCEGRPVRQCAPSHSARCGTDSHGAPMSAGTPSRRPVRTEPAERFESTCTTCLRISTPGCITTVALTPVVTVWCTAVASRAKSTRPTCAADRVLVWRVCCQGG
jgi:hypothetical protein